MQGNNVQVSNVPALPTPHAGIGERRITRTAPQGAPEGVKMTKVAAPACLAYLRTVNNRQ